MLRGNEKPQQFHHGATPAALAGGIARSTSADVPKSPELSHPRECELIPFPIIPHSSPFLKKNSAPPISPISHPPFRPVRTPSSPGAKRSHRTPRSSNFQVKPFPRPPLPQSPA